MWDGGCPGKRPGSGKWNDDNYCYFKHFMPTVFWDPVNSLIIELFYYGMKNEWYCYRKKNKNFEVYKIT